MACSQPATLTLFVVYIVSIVSALANPANLNYEDAYHLTQGANIITLLLLSYCKQTWTDAFFAAILGVAFTMRTTEMWGGGSRWDSLLVTIGILIILQHAFFAAVPKSIGHRTLLYIGFSFMVMPVLAALPHLVHPPAVEDALLQRAVRFSQKVAYMIPKANDVPPPVDSIEWMLYSPETDATVGMSTWGNEFGGNDIYVFFTGSESSKDWQNNVDIRGSQVPDTWGCASAKPLRTHMGYMQAFSSIADPVLAALQSKLATTPTVHRVVFCGHSMGGAIATLAALYVACKMPSVRPNVCCVTFGSPQVGDGNFVAFFNDTVPVCVRVVNPMDPVPRLLNAQFVHVKGYHPVGTFWLENLLDAHMQYMPAMDKSLVARTIASLLPAVVAALAIGLYVAMRLGRAKEF